MFEGIALGTRIAALGRGGSAGGAAAHGHNYGIGHHSHFHEPKQPSPSTLAEELVAASDHRAPHAQSGEHPKTPAGADSIPGSESERNNNNSAGAAHHAPATGYSDGGLLRKKLGLALGFALVTPIGMAIGIGVLRHFNGNDPSTVIAIGTLDALSAGILVWVGVVEMWAHDWMLGGEMTTAGPARTTLGMVALVLGMALMSLLGKWA